MPAPLFATARTGVTAIYDCRPIAKTALSVAERSGRTWAMELSCSIPTPLGSGLPGTGQKDAETFFCFGGETSKQRRTRVVERG